MDVIEYLSNNWDINIRKLHASIECRNILRSEKWFYYFEKFQSNHPKCHKRAVVKSLTDRAKKLCSADNLEGEMKMMICQLWSRMVILAISFKIRVFRPIANVKVMCNLSMYPHHIYLVLLNELVRFWRITT